MDEDENLAWAFKVGRAELDARLTKVQLDNADENDRFNMNVQSIGNRMLGWRMERGDEGKSVNVTFINYRPMKSLDNYIDADPE
jgi:hypothetical protein